MCFADAFFTANAWRQQSVTAGHVSNLDALIEQRLVAVLFDGTLGLVNVVVDQGRLEAEKRHGFAQKLYHALLLVLLKHEHLMHVDEAQHVEHITFLELVAVSDDEAEGVDELTLLLVHSYLAAWSLRIVTRNYSLFDVLQEPVVGALLFLVPDGPVSLQLFQARLHLILVQLLRPATLRIFLLHGRQ